MVSDEELSLEELAEIASSATEEITFEEKNPLDLFIEDVGIKDGDTFVPFAVLYKKFIEWELATNPKLKKPTDFRKFGTRFGKNYDFTKLRKRWRMGYMLDPTPFELTEDEFLKGMSEIRKQRAKEAEKRQQEKEIKEIKRKISSIES